LARCYPGARFQETLFDYPHKNDRNARDATLVFGSMTPRFLKSEKNLKCGAAKAKKMP
jgi:hypothetical protein